MLTRLIASLSGEMGDGSLLDESVQRILGDDRDFPVELIETDLIACLELELLQDLISKSK